MLEIKNLDMCFSVDNKDFKILDNLNISVKKGEFICVLGPSGCGKTILLYLIAGFLKQTSGVLLFENKPIDKPGPERMMVFQNYVLLPWRTVSENIEFALENTSLNNLEKNKQVSKYLDLVGLTNFKDWNIYKLSGGMQQRVAIARALVVNPDLLLMDEPLSALDPQYRIFLREKIEDIWKKTSKTIIFVTHSISEAIYLADKIYLLSPRPAKIRQVYEVKIKRPRKLTSKECILLKEKIEKQMYLDFINSNKAEAINNDIEKKILKVRF